MSDRIEVKPGGKSSLAATALNTGKSAITSAATGARSGLRLAVGTIFAGANMLLDIGVAAARRLPLTGGDEPASRDGEPAANANGTTSIAEPGAMPAESDAVQRDIIALPRGWWRGDESSYCHDDDGVRTALADVTLPLAVVARDGQIGIAQGGQCVLGTIPGAEDGPEGGMPLYAHVPALHPAMLGDASFRHDYGLRFAYLAGAMANGIGSEEIVEAMGRSGMLGFFGAAGLSLDRVEKAIDRLQASLGSLPMGFNLIHSPNEPTLEAGVVDLYLRRGIRLVDASAYLDLTLPLVRYRLAGIHRDANGRVICPNRVMGKVSRPEVARKFLSPPPEAMLASLVKAGDITAEQAEWARMVPVAQDLIVEADSGGHTDNRPAISLIPTMLALRDESQTQFAYGIPLRVGAAGGIGTPSSAAAAFSMGAAFVLTGSINQSCLEAGTSDAVREMLAQASAADVTMAPAADMFEMGVKVQVLKWGTMFAVRARKLYDLYRAHGSLDEIPPRERAALERDFFRGSVEDAWAQTRRFWEQRDPAQIARSEADAKHKMALVFRAYLGQSSKWANAGEPTRKADYQIWCGPAMGAFNEWARGSFLEDWRNRRVVTIAMNLMLGAAIQTRVNWLRAQGVEVPSELATYRPMETDSLRHLLNG